MDKFNPIFITGIQRSGSSIIAKIIQECGVHFGQCSSMMENIEINKIMGDYYKMNKTDDRGQFPLPSDLDIPTDWKEKVDKIYQPDSKTPFGIKGSRLGQTWKLWQYHYPSARWVIVRRRSGDVITSCQKTAFMNAYEDQNVLDYLGLKDDREGWLYWIHWHEQRYREMLEAGLNCKIIWPERILDGDYRQLFELLDWLGLKWKHSIINIINSALIKED